MSEVVNKIKTVGDRIIEARKEKDMTQLDLAKKLGLSRAAVGQWEINSTSPSISKLEEVAMVLGVEPQWLAYNVSAGEARIVYRSPERDSNIQWIAEMNFSDTFDGTTEGAKWGVPSEYLTRELHSNAEQTALCTVNSHAVEPEFLYNDKVFVDRSDQKPSPAGVFVFWDGIGMAFAHMQPVPGTEPQVRITQRGSDSYVIALSEIQIVGRVMGSMRHR
jgi:transcriptional regulator with XRE-family HTH domain